MLQLLKARDAGLVAAIDVSSSRLKFSQHLGANIIINPNEEEIDSSIRGTTDGRGADIVIVATGSVKAFEQSFTIVRKGGIINLFGMPTKDAQLSIDPSRLFINENRIVPSYSTTEKEMKQALELIASNKVKVTELISHRFALADSLEAFRVASDPERSVKVVVNN